MELNKCACKGVRSCIICERDGEAAEKWRVCDLATAMSFYQCHRCGNIAREELLDADSAEKPFFVCSTGSCGQEENIIRARHEFVELEGSCRSPVFEGVAVVKDFVSIEEERRIVSEIDANQWAESQSGRRKQDYGPKVNFKRRKVKLGSFNGLPSFSERLVREMHKQVRELRGFTPVELCNLDYSPERGSAIDPHTDDDWIWGERLVTLNLLSHTYLTFSPISITPSPSTSRVRHSLLRVSTPLPRRSLVIVQGSSRYQWQHSIHREHICSRRLATTLRELTDDFMPGGKHYDNIGREVLETAANFQGTPVNFR